MQCGRCQGTMVLDYLLDLDSGGDLWMKGWRCLICGEVVDPLILRHRQQAARPSSPIKHRHARRLDPVAVEAKSGNIRSRDTRS